MGASADTPRVEPGTERDDDRDAVWRRHARGAPTAGEEATRPSSVSVGEVGSERASPWSREAIEAPLPTVGEIRERWRAELGLDDHRAPSSGRSGSHRVAATSAGSTTTGDVVLAGVLVGTSIVLALLAVWLLPPTSRSGGDDTDRMPAATVARWSVQVQASVRPAHVAVGDGTLVLASGDHLTAYALGDGAELWRHPLTTGLEHVVDVHGDTVVVVGSDRAGAEIAAFDAATGEVRWARPRSSTVVYGLTDDAIIEYDGSGYEPVARVLDHATGESLGGGVVPAMTPGNGSRDAVVGTVGDDLALLDLASGEVVTPTIAPFGLRSIAPVADAVIGFTDANDIVLYDEDGEAVDQRPFVSDAFGDFEGRAELFGGVPGTSIGVVASGTSVGFDVAAGRIELLWELDGRVLSAVSTSAGPVGLARLVDAGTGDVSIGVVDLVDGTVMAITDPDGDREGTATLLDDGYVVPPAVGDPDRTISGYGYDGVERWSLELDRGSWYVTGGGVLVVVDETGDLTVRS